MNGDESSLGANEQNGMDELSLSGAERPPTIQQLQRHEVLQRDVPVSKGDCF
jgi:hypothetical protein